MRLTYAEIIRGRKAVNVSGVIRLGRVLWNALALWRAHRASRMAAALAYYTLFSFTPMLVIATVLAGSVVGQEAARAQVLAVLEEWAGPRGAAFGQAALDNVSRAAHARAGLAGSMLLLYAASNVVGHLKDVLNLFWDVTQRPGNSLGHFLYDRAVALLAVIGIGILLLASVITSTMITALNRTTQGLLPGGPVLWQAVSLLASFSLLSFALAVIFHVLPDTRVHWRPAWFGALVSATLLAVVQLLLALYVRTVAVGSLYGTAGSLVVFMLWVYYSGQIILFGAACSRAFQDHSRGTRQHRPKVHTEM
ncbi:MAG: YihY/virulence factor BrkB family protein [Ardenticatenia bacterium]|nr:YihY/virulence factor BrkB family protein [Ardenticatenia bacterium]